jgi:predicted phage baseplate assembly protein
MTIDESALPTGPDHLAGSSERRNEVRSRRGNGLDTVEVLDERHLALTFLDAAPHGVTADNVRIEGPTGETMPVVGVHRRAEDDSALESDLVVELSVPGGPGQHRLALVEVGPDGRAGSLGLHTLDPLFSAVVFRFDVDRSTPASSSRAGGGATPPGSTGARASVTSDLDYSARDFTGLRQVLLDRLAATSREAVDRHLPDIGMMLVELFAYAGDDLSYYQDAVSTEAYLRTARRRISVRRHARLVDYHLHEGCGARTWVCLEASRTVSLPLAPLVFTTSTAATSGVRPEYTALPAFPHRRAGGHINGPQPRIELNPHHNEITLWHWGRHTCELPAGATATTLLDTLAPAGGERILTLQAGDVLVLEELRDLAGGPPDDSHRHAVRLTSVRRSVDPLYPTPTLEVTWDETDALPFTLAVRAGGGPGRPGDPVICGVARANVVGVRHGVPAQQHLGVGDRTLADQGLSWSQPFPDPLAVARHQASVLRRLFAQWCLTIERWWQRAERGRPLSADQLAILRAQIGDRADSLGLTGGQDAALAARHARGLHRLLLEAAELLAPRRRRLGVLAGMAESHGPLGSTVVAELTEDWGPDLTSGLDPAVAAAWGPATAATDTDPRRALPLLDVSPQVQRDDGPPLVWTAVRDFLDPETPNGSVMVEMDDDRRGRLRFRSGDQPQGPLVARYLVGGGVSGNVAADTINAARLRSPVGPAEPDPALWVEAGEALTAVRSVRNPMAATGGREPEDLAAAKRAIPRSYLIDQPRALNADDYAAWTARVQGVARAAATMRWTGAGQTAEVAVQPVGGGAPDRYLLDRVRRRLDQLRRVGHDVWVRGPGYRPVVLSVRVDVDRDAVRSDLREELLTLLSAGYRSDGSEALFHPQRLGFADSVSTSAVIAAVRAVAGIESVVVTRFCFLGRAVDLADVAVLPPPVRLTAGPLQIIRLDNDPVTPGNGFAEVDLRGGR